MARSDTQPFRREFTIVGSGYIGSEEGFFVPDILSIHLSVSVKFDSIIMQGRVGKESWQNIDLVSSSKDGLHYNNVDVSPFEYIRISGYGDSSTSRDIVFFGYRHNPIAEELITKSSDLDFKQSLETNYTLKEIKDELVKLNAYMYIITGDKL